MHKTLCPNSQAAVGYKNMHTYTQDSILLNFQVQASVCSVRENKLEEPSKLHLTLLLLQ